MNRLFPLSFIITTTSRFPLRGLVIPSSGPIPSWSPSDLAAGLDRSPGRAGHGKATITAAQRNVAVNSVDKRER